MAYRRPLVPGAVRVDVLGVHVSAINQADAIRLLTEWIATKNPHYVCVTGVHGVMESQRDPALRTIHNNSGMTAPDGIPLVWAGRRAGATWMERVYGPDLLLATCSAGLRAGWRHYFYGGGEGVAPLLATRLGEAFPGIQIVGLATPPFRDLTEVESERVVKRINDSGADILWVGLSTPKQERFMAAHIDRIESAQLIGVGAAFDIHAGLLRQAPVALRRAGLEWAFRLAIEPSRLWRRYAQNNPAFVRAIAKRPPKLVPGVGWEC